MIPRRDYSSLPDPKPDHVPDGFEPFPDSPLRGVSQPLGPGEEALILMRQYIRGLVDGGVPGTDFLSNAPRLQIRIVASASRSGWLESFGDVETIRSRGVAIEALEVGGRRAIYTCCGDHQSVSIDRGDWILVILGPLDLERAEILRVAASVQLPGTSP